MKGGYNINMQKKIYIVVTKNLKTNRLFMTEVYQRRNFAHDLACKLKQYYKYQTDMEVHVIERTIDLSLEQCI